MEFEDEEIHYTNEPPHCESIKHVILNPGLYDKTPELGYTVEEFFLHMILFNLWDSMYISQPNHNCNSFYRDRSY